MTELEFVDSHYYIHCTVVGSMDGYCSTDPESVVHAEMDLSKR